MNFMGFYVHQIRLGVYGLFFVMSKLIVIAILRCEK